jgi:hypothetical protein
MRVKGWMGRADQTTKVKGMFVRPEQIAEIGKRPALLGYLTDGSVSSGDGALLEPVSVPTIPCYSLLFGFFQGQGSLPFAAGSCTFDISPRILGLIVTPEDLTRCIESA